MSRKIIKESQIVLSAISACLYSSVELRHFYNTLICNTTVATLAEACLVQLHFMLCHMLLFFFLKFLDLYVIVTMCTDRDKESRLNEMLENFCNQQNMLKMSFL